MTAEHRRRWLLAGLLCVGIAPITRAQAPSPAPTVASVLATTKPSDWRPLDPENTLYLDLPGGRVIIELFPAMAPAHVANVKALVREGYFDGLTVNRAQDNYVVQWGDPDADDEKKRRPVRTARRTLPAEFDRAISADLPFTPLPDGDVYAPAVGWSSGFPVGRDAKEGRTWIAHCYGTLGAGRGNDADSGGGTELFVVIGHSPRHLDRNVTAMGRVVSGIEVLSTLPRGTGALGFYEKPEQRVPIRALRVAADLPQLERVPLEVLRTDTEAFAALVEARRNRREEWFKRPAGRLELCNVPIPLRPGANVSPSPAPNPGPTPADPRLPALFLIGDSTVRNGSGDGANGQWGWGEPLATLFDRAKINVVNRALGGRSSRTYLTGGQWDAVKEMLKPGDFVSMQFGHNDGGAVNDTSRARGSLRGTGGETVEIDNLLTGRHEVVHTYGWYLRTFINDARARGARPIVLSLVPRKTWKDGRIVRDEYANWAAEVARSEGAAFVDLNALVARRYEELGPEGVERFFADHHTHTNRAGAELNAACVVGGLETLAGNPLGTYLSAGAEDARSMCAPRRWVR